MSQRNKRHFYWLPTAIIAVGAPLTDLVINMVAPDIGDAIKQWAWVKWIVLGTMLAATLVIAIVSVRKNGSVSSEPGEPILTASGERSAAVGGDVLAPVNTGDGNVFAHNVTIVNTKPEAQDNAARERGLEVNYLRQMRKKCNTLPLAAFGSDTCTDEDVTLDRVYIDLNTTTKISIENGNLINRRPEAPGTEENRPFTVMEAASQSNRLVLLGDPGAGKSTFVAKLLGWMAAARLDNGVVSSPPGIEHDLLPVLVVLRDLAPLLAELALDGEPDARKREMLCNAVWEQIKRNLAGLEVEGFHEGMKKAFNAGKCLLVLDGLDEVPQRQRTLVRQAVAALIGGCRIQRIIITCRIRSYTGSAVFEGFQAYTLAPFNAEQVRTFTKAWYNAQKDLGRVEKPQADKKAENLATAALSSHLQELSPNPMMLTTMAIIHQRDIGLPDERVRLYTLAVDVLLRRWCNFKAGEKGLLLSDELRNFLKNPDDRLRKAIEHLAFVAHTGGRSGNDAVDLERGRALTILENPLYLGNAGHAAEFLDYVDQRSGLLVGRGGEGGAPLCYSFPHRTFQEYLAGCYLIGQRDVYRQLYERAAEGDFWRLAVILGAEEMKYNRRNDNTLLDIMYRLCPVSEPKDEKTKRAGLWSGEIAALVGTNTINADSGAPDGGKVYFNRVGERLVSLLESELSPLERAEAGNALARLGDLRKEVMEVDKMEFCLVPAGEFRMGSELYDDEKPVHMNNCLTYDYWMSRYPVTNAQFEVFVAAGGYREERYWAEAQKHGVWNLGMVKGRFDDNPRDQPNNYGEPFNLANHPVVGVTWYESLAFTRWLTEKWRETGLLEKEWNIRLPNEPEWEKAARGGLVIPESPFITIAPFTRRDAQPCVSSPDQRTKKNDNSARIPLGRQQRPEPGELR